MTIEPSRELAKIEKQSSAISSEQEALESLINREVSGNDFIKLITGGLLVVIKDERIRDGMKTISGLAQAAIRGDFWKQIGKGVDVLIKTGDVLEDEEGKLPQSVVDSITELIDFIDSEKTSDTNRQLAIKCLFLVSIRKSVDEGDRILARELLVLTKNLRGGDILVLKACFEIRNKTKERPTGIDAWAKMVADHIGHRTISSVLRHDEILVREHLLGRRTYDDLSGIARSGDFRLTDLGIKFCEFLTDAEK